MYERFICLCYSYCTTTWNTVVSTWNSKAFSFQLRILPPRGWYLNSSKPRIARCLISSGLYSVGLKMKRYITCSVHSQQTFELIGRNQSRKDSERTETGKKCDFWNRIETKRTVDIEWKAPYYPRITPFLPLYMRLNVNRSEHRSTLLCFEPLLVIQIIWALLLYVWFLTKLKIDRM